MLGRARHATGQQMLLLLAADENHFLLCKPLIGNLVQSGMLLLPLNLDSLTLRCHYASL